MQSQVYTVSKRSSKMDEDTTPSNNINFDNEYRSHSQHKVLNATQDSSKCDYEVNDDDMVNQGGRHS